MVCGMMQQVVWIGRTQMLEITRNGRTTHDQRHSVVCLQTTKV